MAGRHAFVQSSAALNPSTTGISIFDRAMLGSESLLLSIIWSAPGGDTSISTLCPKTFTFHLDFGSEIVEQTRYERLTLYSLEHLGLADMALGRIKEE